MQNASGERFYEAFYQASLGLSRLARVIPAYRVALGYALCVPISWIYLGSRGFFSLHTRTRACLCTLLRRHVPTRIIEARDEDPEERVAPGIVIHNDDYVMPTKRIEPIHNPRFLIPLEISFNTLVLSANLSERLLIILRDFFISRYLTFFFLYKEGLQLIE